MVELIGIVQCSVCARYFQEMTQEGAMLKQQEHYEKDHKEDIEGGGLSARISDVVQSQEQSEGLP